MPSTQHSLQDALAISAAGPPWLIYKKTQKASLDHIRQLSRTTEPERGDRSATRRSLELTQTIRTATREGSLLDVVDRTVTSMGCATAGSVARFAPYLAGAN